jgi:hypothetical protein
MSVPKRMGPILDSSDVNRKLVIRDSKQTTTTAVRDMSRHEVYVAIATVRVLVNGNVSGTVVGW